MSRPSRPRAAPWDEDDDALVDGTWPGAPEPQYDENGDMTNAEAECEGCGAPSTLCYRCSVCGSDLVAQGAR